jgi:hypothetical protein
MVINICHAGSIKYAIKATVVFTRGVLGLIGILRVGRIPWLYQELDKINLIYDPTKQ